MKKGVLFACLFLVLWAFSYPVLAQFVPGTGNTPIIGNLNRLPNPVPNSPESEEGPGIGDMLGNAILYIFHLSFYLTTIILSLVLDLSGKLIDFAYSAHHLASSDMVGKGWTFVRDALNFIFILILLAISFSTIAGLETFQMKKLLPRLLFSALLVNFSLVIAATFLQSAQVMTDTFASSVMPQNKYKDCQESGDDKKIGCRLVFGLMNSGKIASVYSYENIKWLESFKLRAALPKDENGNTTTIPSPSLVTSANFQSYLGVVAKSAIATVFIGLFAVAFIFLGSLMFVRIVALVILLIMAPIPYVFSLIPPAKKYGDEWWSRFINYTFFLPIVTFFLALAINIMSASSTGNDPTKNTALVTQFWGDGANSSMWVDVLASMVDVVFISVFIFASAYAAKALSIFGAQGAMSLAKGTVSGAAKLSMLPARGAKALTVKGTSMAASGIAGRMTSDKASSFSKNLVSGISKARGAMGATGRAFGGKIDEQIATQQKALAGKSEDDIKAACRMGNAGACAKLADSGDLDAKDFPAAVNLIPKNTAARDKMEAAWAKKDPISAVLGTKQRAQLRSSATGTPEATAKKDALQKAFKKMKPEDFAKLSGDDLEDAIKAGVEMPMTKSQLDAAVNSTNASLQTAAEKHLQDLAKKPTLNPGQKAMLAYAKNKLNMNIP